MNKEEIESLFKKYKVRIPKEKQGQSECHECKRHHKYSLTWTSFLYEYKENYYCFEHIVNILLQQENKQLKIQISAREEVCNRLENNWNKLKEIAKSQSGFKKRADLKGGLWFEVDDLLDKMHELEQGSDSNE